MTKSRDSTSVSMARKDIFSNPDGNNFEVPGKRNGGLT
jgi:hypothetical protein